MYYFILVYNIKFTFLEHPELLDIQKEKNSQLDAMLKGLTVPAEKLEVIFVFE